MKVLAAGMAWRVSGKRFLGLSCGVAGDLMVLHPARKQS